MSRGRRLTSRAGLYAALLCLGVLFAFPFYWMIVTSIEPVDRLSDIPPNVLPLWEWRNYAAAWTAAPWPRYFFNTVFVACAATILVLLTSTPAAYAFAALRFPGRNILFMAVLLVLVIPDNVILVVTSQVRLGEVRHAVDKGVSGAAP